MKPSGNKLTKNRRKVVTGKDSEVKTVDSKSEGLVYPIDVWFLISQRISPECVGKFALICRESYQVVQSAAFWHNLYKRYYRQMPELPERLTPECMTRRYCLRACVIRALHYVYFPRSTIWNQVPHNLVGRKCGRAWSEVGKHHWFHFFKMKVISEKNTLQLSSANRKKKDLMEELEDIWANPEEGCKVLRVASRTYTYVPAVHGLNLQKVKMNLSPHLMMQLQLVFSPSYVSSTVGVNAIFSNVLEVKVLDWWQPLYPHETTSFLFPNCDADQ